MKTAFRASLAKLLRTLPSFRGKGRIGKFLQRLTTNPKEASNCLVTFRMKDGTSMRVDLRSYTEEGSFWTGEYEGGVIGRLMSCLREGSVVFDVGANVGFYSIPLGKRLLELGGHIYSVEPVPANHSRLVENVRLNHLETAVRPLNLALGDSVGAVQLSMGKEYSAATGNAVIVAGDSNGDPASSARITTLDLLAAELAVVRCDLIKVDVEGYEYAFLKGGRAFLERTKPLVFLELNYHWMNHFGWSLSDLQRFGSSIGYACYREIPGGFVPADAAGVGIENGLMVPRGTEVEVIARSNFSFR
jgi:FkbM family methyltransferase